MLHFFTQYVTFLDKKHWRKSGRMNHEQRLNEEKFSKSGFASHRNLSVCLAVCLSTCLLIFLVVTDSYLPESVDDWLSTVRKVKRLKIRRRRATKRIKRWHEWGLAAVENNAVIFSDNQFIYLAPSHCFEFLWDVVSSNSSDFDWISLIDPSISLQNK